MKKKMLKVLFIFSLVLFYSVSYGQSVKAKYEVGEDNAKSASCELNNLYVLELITKAEKNNERIFIISRIGKTEKSIIGTIRSDYAFWFLTQVKRMKKETVVNAIGNGTNEKRGRLEFYVGSELFLVSFAEKNKKVCFMVGTL